MNRDFELLDIDRITAKMYGISFRGRRNLVPLSKHGLDKLEKEVDSILDMVEYEFFAPSKEKFWKNSSLKKSKL